ncbi:hypothetical protein [Nereida ignava]|uniref:hypothetical protein n=1 Tax=Nereida ignava TaxID=282199 RepID=UPI0030F9ED44
MWWLLCTLLPLVAYLWKHSERRMRDWTQHYTQALLRPAWATDIPLGMPSDFVSWAGLPSRSWDVEVRPSVSIVQRSLAMRPALEPVLPALPLLLAGCAPSVVAAAVVYHVQQLAGTGMTAEEASAHAMMVYHVKGFEDDHAATASRFVASHQSAFQVAAPNLLARYTEVLQQQFQVDLRPTARQPPPRSPAPPPIAVVDPRKEQ